MVPVDVNSSGIPFDPVQGQEAGLAHTCPGLATSTWEVSQKQPSYTFSISVMLTFWTMTLKAIRSSAINSALKYIQW